MTIVRFGTRYRIAILKGVKSSILRYRNSCRVNGKSFCVLHQGQQTQDDTHREAN